MGKRKKFEKVCASKISLAGTAMNSPMNVEATAMTTMAGMAALQMVRERSVRKAARMIGTKAFMLKYN
jgi:hypothetical protein